MEWLFGEISIRIELGPLDDSDMGLAIKTKNIPLGVEVYGGLDMSAKEASSARNVEYWPRIKMGDLDRREKLFNATTNILDSADRIEEKHIGFFIAGFEVTGVPSWEVAEEVVKALHRYSKECNGVEKVVIVAGTPTQLSSFQYALDNVSVIV
ncbi:MAG: hypothetical protein ACTSU3_05575 [Candidatus Thorarchaeota archaeon]